MLAHRQPLHLAASLVLLDLLSTEWESSLSTLGARRCWLGLHSGLDLAGHGQESLLDIVSSLGRCLEELDSEALGELLSLFRRNDALCCEIRLVTDQELVDVLCGVSVDFVEPLLDVVEGFVVCHVVDNDDSVGTAIVRRCDCAEAFLASGIPDLKLDGLSIELDGADFEINTDCGDVRLSVSVVGESEKQTGLSDTGVSDEEEFEEVIAVVAVMW